MPSQGSLEPERRGGGEPPAGLQRAPEWPGPGDELVSYKPTQRGRPSVQSPPAPPPWPHGGTVDGAAMNQSTYYSVPAYDHTNEVYASRHIHEHHHYGQLPSYPSVPMARTAIRYGMVGFMMKVPPEPAPGAPPFVPLGNEGGAAGAARGRRSFDAPPPYYPPPGAGAGCPFHGEFSGVYRQVVPYPEVAGSDRHVHFHQHYYHSHYRYRPAVEPPPSHRPRFVPHHQARHHAHHAYHFGRPYFVQEGFQWHNRHGAYHRAHAAPDEYDMSSLGDVLNGM